MIGLISPPVCKPEVCCVCVNKVYVNVFLLSYLYG